jgi:hypothetical protein
MEGDVSAIKEVADRLDGRVPQLVGGDREPGDVPIRSPALVLGRTSADRNYTIR